MKSKFMVGIAAMVLGLVLAPRGAWALGFGAQVGLVQNDTGPTGDSRGLFGRMGLIGPLDLQVDLAKIDYDAGRQDGRFGIGLRLEPLHLGHWLPALWAGTGLVDASAPAWSGKLGF